MQNKISQRDDYEFAIGRKVIRRAAKRLMMKGKESGRMVLGGVEWGGMGQWGSQRRMEWGDEEVGRRHVWAGYWVDGRVRAWGREGGKEGRE